MLCCSCFCCFFFFCFGFIVSFDAPLSRDAGAVTPLGPTMDAGGEDCCAMPSSGDSDEDDSKMEEVD